MGVQLPWSMARLTGEVRPEKPWKWEISSPLQLEPWPQAEMAYCITYQRHVRYLTVNTYESPKTINWTLRNTRTHKKTRKQEPSHVAACVKLAIYKEDNKESQAEGAKCPEAGWLATEAVCRHAGTLEQPSAPDEHVFTQTYRKNHAPHQA